MNSWMTTPSPLQNAASPNALRIDRQLRLMDITLATLALALLALPLALGWVVGRPRAVRYWGHTPPHFNRWLLDYPDSLPGRVFARMGMTQWPVLVNILAGDMAWVGPKAVPVEKDQRHGTQAALRPGLVNIWDLRQRTAVDFGTEQDAELEYLSKRSLLHDFGLLLRVALVAWLPSRGAAKAPNAERVCVGDVFFDNIDMAQAIEQLSRMIDGNTTQQVSFVNPACVNIAAHDRGYRRILARAAMVLPDGIGIKIAADIMGLPLKQNVNGTDLFPRLCAMLERRGASLFLLGGQPGVAERVAQAVQAQWPTLRIAGYRDGFFGVAQEGEVAAEVRASGADVLLVARGVPMQDIFIDRQLHQLGVKVAIGVGGLFDFVSGRISRAPRWMRDTGLEWVYRLKQEPSRMWQRYLVGNFTFMGRIMLQRLGFRQSANDTLKAESMPALSTSQRCVLFATTPAALDIPVPFDFCAAMLPFGSSSFLEQTLDQLADLGIKQLDLVVSERPEALRQLLAQGERWGIELRWHLVKDAANPYNLLQSLGLSPTGLVLLGHADRWIAADVLANMVTHGQVLAHTQDATVRWTGWGMASAATLQTTPLHCDEATLGAHLCSQTTQLQVLEAAQFVNPCTASALLAAQQVALTDEFICRVPATWLRTPWGAYSPDAVLEKGAHLLGPALIGPGCFVAQGAHIGAGTVLTRDVVVSAGAVIRHSVVLPQTLVGQQLELDGTVVHGASVQHLALGVRTVLPAADGLLLDLHRQKPPGTSWLARATAGVVCLVCLPWLAVDTGVRRMRGLPLRWIKQAVVVGRDADTARLQLRTLRCAPESDTVGHLMAQFGAWLDVLQGLRCWFGARPRGLSEWYGMGRDWQQLLVHTPIGCLHAPAWSDHSGDHSASVDADSRAGADVFFAVRQGWGERLRIVRAWLSQRLMHPA